MCVCVCVCARARQCGQLDELRYPHFRWQFRQEPCIGKITFFVPFPFNNQPDALINQIYSVIKTLHVSGIFFAHHQ